MDLTLYAAVVSLAGLALIVAGLVLLLGSWALVGCGAVLVVIGLVFDVEKLA